MSAVWTVHRSQYSIVMISLFPFSTISQSPFTFFCRLKWIRKKDRRWSFSFWRENFRASSNPTMWRHYNKMAAAKVSWSDFVSNLQDFSCTQNNIFASVMLYCHLLVTDGNGFYVCTRDRDLPIKSNCWFREIAKKTANSNLSLSLLGSYTNGMDDHGWKL